MTPANAVTIVLESPTSLDDAEAMCRNALATLRTRRAIEDSESFALELLVREALTNAVQHGNADDPAQRMMLSLVLDQEGITIRVSDEGPGFNWRGALGRPLDTVSATGRGMAIYAQYADRIFFNEAGNAVTLKRFWREGEQYG